MDKRDRLARIKRRAILTEWKSAKDGNLTGVKDSARAARLTTSIVPGGGFAGVVSVNRKGALIYGRRDGAIFSKQITDALDPTKQNGKVREFTEVSKEPAPVPKYDRKMPWRMRVSAINKLRLARARTFPGKTWK